MTYLIDTNVISELRRPNQADRKIVRWFESIEISSAFLSSITIAELEQGAAMAELSGKPHAPVLRYWIDEQVLPAYAGRIIPVDEIVATRFGRLQAPDPRPYADVMIAATAQVHGLTIVTRNSKHFTRFNVPLLNPWDLP